MEAVGNSNSTVLHYRIFADSENYSSLSEDNRIQSESDALQELEGLKKFVNPTPLTEAESKRVALLERVIRRGITICDDLTRKRNLYSVDTQGAQPLTTVFPRNCLFGRNITAKKGLSL